VLFTTPPIDFGNWVIVELRLPPGPRAPFPPPDLELRDDADMTAAMRLTSHGEKSFHPLNLTGNQTGFLPKR